MSHHPKKRNWHLFVASVLIVTTLAVPLARVILPPVHRAMQLNKLQSDDASIRAAGQTYLLRRAESDPAVVEGAIARLKVEDETIFHELLITLDQLGYWTRDRIPPDHWLRWLGIVVRDVDPEERIRGMQLVADLPEHAGDERVQSLLYQLAADVDPTVRYNALVCLAEMRGSAVAMRNLQAAAVYESMLSCLTDDPHAIVARHAYLFSQLIGLPIKPPSTPAHLTDPDVAEAMLWASLRNRSQSRAAAVAALNDAAASPRVRAMAAYALGLAAGDEARAALIAFLDQGPAAVNDDNQVAFWRAILALPLAPRSGELQPGQAPPASDDPGYTALVRFLAKCRREDYDNVNLRPLILACLFRDRTLLIDAAIRQSDIVTIADDPVAWLATIEGIPEAHAQKRAPLSTLKPPPDVHEQIHLAILRAMAAPAGEDFLPLCISEKSAIRDQAVSLAARRLPADETARLIRTLLAPLDLKGDPLKPVYRYHDEAKLSAAMLIGLTGNEVGLLHRMADDFAGRTGVIEIIQLALWMQDQPVHAIADMTARAHQFLLREDLPAGTVLLALLHRNDPLALERLLTPRGDQRPELLRMLDVDRWWYVLENHLPDDAPRLWIWADNELARFQLDLLRNWYVVNRYRLRPAPPVPPVSKPPAGSSK